CRSGPRPRRAWPPCASAAAWALPPSSRSADDSFLNLKPGQALRIRSAGPVFFCVLGAFRRLRAASATFFVLSGATTSARRLAGGSALRGVFLSQRWERNQRIAGGRRRGELRSPMTAFPTPSGPSGHLPLTGGVGPRSPHYGGYS